MPYLIDIDGLLSEKQRQRAALDSEIAALEQVKRIAEAAPQTIARPQTQVPVTTREQVRLRPGSSAFLAYQALDRLGREAHIDHIRGTIEELFGPDNVPDRSSLISALAKMDKAGKLFYRTDQPNTFGLRVGHEARPDGAATTEEEPEDIEY